MSLFRLLWLSLVALYVWFYWRVMRPLQQLSRSAQKLREGDFTALEHHYHAAPEIDHLQKAMNAMVGHVRRSQAQERTYIEALTSGQEAERARIARELHDDTTQSLIAIAQSLEIAQNFVEPNSPASTMLGTTRAQAIETVNNLRVLIANLRPPSLIELGLIPALHMLAEGISNMEITIEATGAVRRLTEAHELALFRSAQEAIWNAQRHGQATALTVQMIYSRATVQMIVQDNGIGFTPPSDWSALPAHRHYGLIGIRERIQLLGGKLQLDSQPGQGTRLEIDLPLHDSGQPASVVRDPVCSAIIQPNRAYASVEYRGNRYYFCCPVCQGAFQANPDEYVDVKTR